MSEEKKYLLEKYIEKLNTTLIPIITEKISDQNKELITQNLENSLKKKYHDLLLRIVDEKNELMFNYVLKEIAHDWLL